MDRDKRAKQNQSNVLNKIIPISTRFEKSIMEYGTQINVIFDWIIELIWHMRGLLISQISAINNQPNEPIWKTEGQDFLRLIKIL